MKEFSLTLTSVLLALNTMAQVDIEHRRTLFVESGASVYHSEEPVGGVGYFWFNENNYPWTNTALRVIFAGVFVDAELSCFLPAATNTAVGVGAGGGLYIDSLTPYYHGEDLSHQNFTGHSANTRVFINQTIPNPQSIPINVRSTYAVSGQFYQSNSDTENYVVPNNTLTQTLSTELRLGGIEPGLTSTRGVELYLSLDANYRSGFEAFGPVGATYPVHSEYERVFTSLGGKLPVGQTVLFARIAGGWGDNLDQLSSWKIGGNLINIEAVTYTLHGYYTHEFFASDFGLANMDWTIPLCKEHGIAAHLYGDWAIIKPPPPDPREYHNYFGVGAGLGFNAFWKTTWLVSYGYGINAIRNGENGGHEIALALERKF